MAKAIEVVIVGDATQLQAALGKASASVEGFAGKAAAAGAKMTSFGKTLSTHLTLPIVAAGAVSVKFAVDFAHSMELVHTQAGASQKEVEKMSAAVLKLSPSVATGPNELAKALYHIESVGLRGAHALNVLKEAALGAKVGNADLEATTNALSAAWVSGIQGAGNMRQAMGTLNAIVGVGNMRMDDLAAAMSSGILPAAKTFGISLQSVGAALATMTDAGVPAQDAATRLRMTFSLLGAPTSKAATLLKSIHIGAEDLANAMRRPGGLTNAIQMLHDHLQGLTKTQQAALLSGAFGGGRSSSTILTLVGNLDRLRTKYDDIGTGISKYGASVKATTETAQFKFNQALAQLEVTGIQIGAKLIPILLRLAGMVAKVASAFSGLSPEMQNIVVVSAVVVAALGPILVVGGNIVKTVGLMARAFTFLAGAETAAAAEGDVAAASMVGADAAGVGLAATLGPLALIALPVIAAGFLAAAGRTQDMTGAMHEARDATDKLGTALDNLKHGRTTLKDTAKNQQDAANALIAAENTQRHLLEQGKKGTKEYGAAVADVTQKKKDFAAATKASGDAQAAFNDDLISSSKAFQAQAKGFGDIGLQAQKAAIRTADYNAQMKGFATPNPDSVKNSASAMASFATHVANAGAAAQRSAADMNNGLTPSMRRGRIDAAAMAQGAIDLSKKIHAIPTTKQILVYYHTHMSELISQAQNLQRAIDQLHGKVLDIVTNYHVHGRTAQNPGGNAAGTQSWRGGWTWVGERGPELMRLPSGTQIRSHAESVRGGSAGRPTQVNLVLDRRVLASVLVDADKTYRRQNGGRSLFAVSGGV